VLGLNRSVASTLSGHAVLDVVARFDGPDGIESQLPAAAPDLILFGLKSGQSETESHLIAPALLALLPRTKIIFLASDGRNAYIHTMRAGCVALPDISPRALVGAILARPDHAKI
jgi:DNA-binding NarL/FixJ family response regulator